MRTSGKLYILSEHIIKKLIGKKHTLSTIYTFSTSMKANNKLNNRKDNIFSTKSNPSIINKESLT